MEKIKRFLEIDLLEKCSIIRNEIQTSFVTLDYLSNLEIAGLLKNTFKIIEKIKIELKTIDNDLKYCDQLINESFWKFINYRAKILRKFKKYIDEIGTIQKSLAERLDALPHLYPPPPILRQKEIYKALKLLDSTAEGYYKSIKQIYNCIETETEYVLPVWDYTVDDKLLHVAEGSLRHQLIKSTYWTMLLPNYIPILAHEVAHTFIIKKEEVLKEKWQIENLEKKVILLSEALFPNYSFSNFARDLVTEIFVDINAALIAGPPYVFSIFEYLIRDQIYYEVFGIIQNFPILRLKIVTDYTIKNRSESSIKYPDIFYDFLKEILRFCNEYYEILNNVDESISAGLIPIKPDIRRKCEMKNYYDNALYNIISDHIGLVVNDRFPVAKSFDQAKLMKFITDSGEGKFSYKLLSEAGITDATDIPILLWQLIISHEEEKKPFPTGRICQESYRLISEECENKIEIDELICESFYLGKIVEFLFMKINWSSVERKNNIKININQQFEKLKENIKNEDDGIKLIGHYHCIGSFDLLLIATDFSVKKMLNLDWPPQLLTENIDCSGIKYFPKSEVYQEIRFDDRVSKQIDYSENLKDFLSNANCFCLYQIKLKKEKVLPHALQYAITNLKELRIKNKNLSIFFLKSIGWEDLIIIFKNFDNLDIIEEIKYSFSKDLSHSLTTIFYNNQMDIDNVKLGSSEISTFLKINNYKDMHEINKTGETDDFDLKILTGIFDCQLSWKNKPEMTIGKIDNNLFKFIEKFKYINIIDINSFISFSNKKE